MKTRLWLLYEKQFDVGLAPIPWDMARHCITFDISFDIRFIEYFTLVDNTLYYKDSISSDLPNVIFFRGYNINLAKWFENNGVQVINSSFAMEACKDKWLSYQLVARTNIPQPLTLNANPHHSFTQVGSTLGIPFVAKDRFGMKGEGVYLIDSEESFGDIKSSTNNFADFLFQQFISHSHGKDCRVYIAGDKIIGGVYRYNPNDFRANLSQGGNFFDYPVSDDLRSKAFEISRVLKAEVVAIDFLFGEEDMIFCEANANAGFRSFNRLGYHTTELIMYYICNEVILGHN